MTASVETAASGKGSGDENFPVASGLIHPRHRAPILAFYRFVRAADDVADNPTLSPDEKLRLLDRLDAALGEDGPPEAAAGPLRAALAERGLSPRHARDLLDAFRLDARKSRYEDWDDLMHYCALSAMPVGRFVLDVHGEDETTWAASDPLCAALQVINHLQDCAKDFRELDRIYLPRETMDRHGAKVTELAAARSSPPLLATIRELNDRTAGLLRRSAAFPSRVRDLRLGLEVSVIQTLAEALVEKLRRRDPLCQRVHASKGEMLGRAVVGVVRAFWVRSGPARGWPHPRTVA